MANVKLRWALPTTRLSGKPLDPATIKHVELAISADGGASFTVTDTLPATVLETVFTDLEPGVWRFRGVVVDTANRRSPEVLASVDVPDVSPPGSLTLLEATLV